MFKVILILTSVFITSSTVSLFLKEPPIKESKVTSVAPGLGAVYDPNKYIKTIPIPIDPESIAKDSKVFRRVMNALQEQMNKLDFSVYDEAFSVAVAKALAEAALKDELVVQCPVKNVEAVLQKNQASLSILASVLAKQQIEKEESFNWKMITDPLSFITAFLVCFLALYETRKKTRKE